jgi:hypothetical protein
LKVLLEARARSYENTTSSAVKGVPSWKRTPWRSFTIHFVGETFSHDVASHGTIRYCLSRCARYS